MKRRIKAWFDEAEYYALRQAVEIYSTAADKIFKDNIYASLVKQTLASLEDKLCKVEVEYDDER